MKNSAKILFSGDFVYSNELSDKNFEISKEFQKVIDEHQIFCCNLEGPIINSEFKKIKKVGPNIHNNQLATKKINECGGNLFCLANNHIFDYGKEGLENTLNFLNKEKIKYIGAGLNKKQIYTPYSTVINGIKITFINIAENGFGASIEKEYGYLYAFDKELPNIIRNAKEKSDFVFIISHMGAEHWKIPLLEVRTFYKELIEIGADCIIAHHPHVPQGWEEYKGVPIFYSLGNFIFDKGKGIQNPKSFVVSICLEKDKKIQYSIISTKFENYILKIDNTEYTELADILKDNKKYENLLKQYIFDAYSSYKNKYYKVVSYDKGNLKEFLKGFIKRNFLRKKFSDLWLYHNLNIETHYWICKRVTRLIIEENMEKER